jgi:hypothetical protein
MKLWMVFVIITILCWGAYVPTIHHGQRAFGGTNAAFRAFLFVGLAYFLSAGFILVYMIVTRAEPMVLTGGGVWLSTLAGLFGAGGALGVIFALKWGGAPIYVAPLVFAGAPLVNTFVSMAWSKSRALPSPWFFVGILLAGAGAALVLRFKPA